MKFGLGSRRLQAGQAVLMSDDWGGMIADKIAVAPGVIPIGMAVEYQELATGEHILDCPHDNGHILRAEERVANDDVAPGNDNVAIDRHAADFTRDGDETAEDANASVIDGRADLEERRLIFHNTLLARSVMGAKEGNEHIESIEEQTNQDDRAITGERPGSAVVQRLAELLGHIGR